jgi:beta-lactam-binding protein with PASTA domain
MKVLKKLFDSFLWVNLLCMAVVIVLLMLGVHFGLNFYTNHGEEITVPDVNHKAYEDAYDILDDLGLEAVVVDTSYVRTLPPGCVLEQTPKPGAVVKSGRIIYLTINATAQPTMPLPDIIDNSSERNAKARLTAMGFRIGETEYIPGEEGWVYGVKVNGRSYATGQQVPINALIILQVGNGMRNAADSVYQADAADYMLLEENEEEEIEEDDDFEVIE